MDVWSVNVTIRVQDLLSVTQSRVSVSVREVLQDCTVIHARKDISTSLIAVSSHKANNENKIHKVILTRISNGFLWFFSVCKQCN